MRADALTLRRLSQARIRLVIAFAATISGEVLSRVLHGTVPHWICATAVILVALTQLYTDLRSERSSNVLLSAPAVVAIAALYIMSTNETFFAPPMAHAGGHAHSHAHMVCVATEFIMIAKYFEKSAKFSAAEALEEMRLLAPKSGARAGETVKVLRSEVFPVDGLLADGDTTVDESAITGARARVAKKVGDTVFCGSVNFEHTVDVTASGSQEESIYFRRLLSARESVSRGRTGCRLLVSRCADVIPLLIFVAGIGAIAFAAFFGEHGAHKAAMRVISVAIAATPAVMALFSPMADAIGFSSLAKIGIIFKSAVCAERIANTKKIYLDESALLHGEMAERRQGADKTIESLQKLGFLLSTSPSDAVTVASCREVGADAFAASPLRVAIGKADGASESDADVLITQDRITHLLRAVFVGRVLQRNLRMGFAIALCCNVIVIVLAAAGVLTPVYSGIAAAVVTIGLLANNRLIEKRCQGITFNKLYKYAAIKKGRIL